MKKHLNPSTVISCIALFVALSGAAYAATLGKNAVKAKNIAKGAVTSPKIKNGAVTAARIANGAVIGSKIANGAVGSSKLADASVRSNALGGGVVTSGKIKDLNVTEGKIANGAVTGPKLGASVVDTGKLANEAVTGEKIDKAVLGQLVKNVSYFSAASVSNSTDEQKSVVAECPVGKDAIGGGGRITGTELEKVALTQSFPLTNGVTGRTNAWSVQAREIEPEAKAWAVEAHVICAEL